MERNEIRESPSRIPPRLDAAQDRVARFAFV
jgi:hypothetical protein